MLEGYLQQCVTRGLPPPLSASLRPFLSYPLRYGAPMKFKHLISPHRSEAETIASFGTARLVKDLNRKFHLIGGTPTDRAAAREWCSHFLHEAVIPPDPKAP